MQAKQDGELDPRRVTRFSSEHSRGIETAAELLIGAWQRIAIGHPRFAKRQPPKTEHLQAGASGLDLEDLAEANGERSFHPGIHML
jgi:hypothetical protein